MSFYASYQKEATLTIKAPGRVNILGEHTDYNYGLVLPMPINRHTCVYIGAGQVPAHVYSHKHANGHEKASNRESANGREHASPHKVLHSESNPHISVPIYMASAQEPNDGVIIRDLFDEPRHHWTDYIIGSVREIYETINDLIELHAGEQTEFEFPHLQFFIESTIPMGSGLSSSAALEVGVLKTVRDFLLNTHKYVPKVIIDKIESEKILDNINIAKMARRVENNYVGLPCGLMDQMVISVGREHQALLIDFKDTFNSDKPPQIIPVPLPDNYSFLVISSGITHKLTLSGDEGYKTRFDQCQKGAAVLKIPHLSVLSLEDLKRIIDTKKLSNAIVQKRVQHIVEENHRVKRAVAALKARDIAIFAECMNDSHYSQKDLFEVSIAEIDALVETAKASGALAARLTGGGFGGSIICLVDKGNEQDIWKKISAKHSGAKILI